MSTSSLARAVDASLEATVVGSFSRVGYAARRHLDGWESVERLEGNGRHVVVTGGNSGLGYATARALLRTGAAVTLVVRSDDKGRDATAALRHEAGAEVPVTHVVADLADLASVRAVADRLLDQLPRIDVLVHNAGAMFAERGETDDGFERTYQVHVLGPHLLTARLLPRLVASAPARVVTVTSGGMYAEKLDVGRLESPRGYRPAVAYARAKRAQVALTGAWQQRVEPRGVDVHVMHPGWAATPGVTSSLPRFDRVMGPLLRDADQGADTIVWLILSDEVGAGGRLWLDRRPRSAHKVPWTRHDPAEVTRLWAKVSADAGLDPDIDTAVMDGHDPQETS